MPSVARELPVDYPRNTEAQLMECRRNILRYARLFPNGPQGDHDKWLSTHTVEGFGRLI
jgi:hypothetical protein